MITLTADTIRPLTLDDYAADRARVVEVLLDSGATAVLEVGSVGVPGISDLDLVACFPDDLDLRPLRAPLERALREADRGFLHGPWAIRGRHLARLPSLFAFRQIRDLLGGPVPEHTQTPTQRLLWNIEASATVLGRMDRQRTTTTRSALCLLNGVRYNIDLAVRDGVVPPERHADFARRITSLRSEWFATDAATRRAEIAASWDAAVDVLRDLLAGYAVRLRGLLRDPAAETLLTVPGANLTYCFTDRNAPRLLLSHPFTTTLALPKELGVIFQLLAAPGLGLDRWLTIEHVGPDDDPRIDPQFALAAHAYARNNAAYLDDMIHCPAPFMLLGGGTLGGVRVSTARRVLGALRRVRDRLVGTPHKA